MEWNEFRTMNAVALQNDTPPPPPPPHLSNWALVNDGSRLNREKRPDSSASSTSSSDGLRCAGMERSEYSAGGAVNALRHGDNAEEAEKKEREKKERKKERQKKTKKKKSAVEKYLGGGDTWCACVV